MFNRSLKTGVAKSREAYLKLNSAAKDSLRAFDDAMSCAYAGARTISEKVLLNTEANAEAAFDAAQLISRAKTFPEVVSPPIELLTKASRRRKYADQGVLRAVDEGRSANVRSHEFGLH